MGEEIVNKVAESGLITLDLEQYCPQGEIKIFDLKDYLFMNMILKESEFRQTLKNLDWEPYHGKNVAVKCSADAIIPVWAYMLVGSYLQPIANEIIVGDEKEAQKQLFLKSLSAIDLTEFSGKKIVVKGCGEKQIGEFAYLEITKLLRPVAKSIMYGEPCSTVPIYKQK
jgi:hypothetical protein